MRISDWSSDVCASDLLGAALHVVAQCQREEVFDESGAAAAAGRRLAGAAHGVEAARAPGDARDDLALGDAVAAANQIGRAHVRTPVTNAHLVCRLLLDNKTPRLPTLVQYATSYCWM